MITTKLKLPNVTLIAMGSTNVSGMIDALEYSSKYIEFGCVKLVSHICPRVSSSARPIEFGYNPPIRNIDQWNHAVIFKLWEHVDTSHAILVHPDGFVVHPESWKDGWLDYDYIGAPWPMPTDNYSYRDPEGNIVRVGNSVSLRSRRIMKLPKELGLEWRSYFGNTNEDGYLTCHQRLVLEANGCVFSPIEVARYFSRELEIPENQDVDKPFCFHKNAGRNSQYPCFEN